MTAFTHEWDDRCDKPIHDDLRGESVQGNLEILFSQIPDFQGSDRFFGPEQARDYEDTLLSAISYRSHRIFCGQMVTHPAPSHRKENRRRNR